MTEPEWIEITRMGSRYEEQLDVRAEKGSPNEYRHRQISFTGQAEHEWKPGPAPLPSDL